MNFLNKTTQKSSTSTKLEKFKRLFDILSLLQNFLFRILKNSF